MKFFFSLGRGAIVFVDLDMDTAVGLLSLLGSYVLGLATDGCYGVGLRGWKVAAIKY
jgi:hypothetical protein